MGERGRSLEEEAGECYDFRSTPVKKQLKQMGPVCPASAPEHCALALLPSGEHLPHPGPTSKCGRGPWLLTVSYPRHWGSSKAHNKRQVLQDTNGRICFLPVSGVSAPWHPSPTHPTPYPQPPAPALISLLSSFLSILGRILYFFILLGTEELLPYQFCPCHLRPSPSSGCHLWSLIWEAGSFT